MFDTFEKLADDPILGLIGAYKNDKNPQKIEKKRPPFAYFFEERLIADDPPENSSILKISS